ncbi:hypothetical protein [Opitutus terrae]|uniref:Uncharacterized protein n=1 Tax=Opitutus terrae (strain DSM 11246 / JCM 15787 / PB90-1) TaxID=452637 RepID=B1ZU83_OPITP|nr:hypothetical protein [Opitutus terrae]ACB76692.1 hypothetical protein Oter_3415 [Opitutus terrae PB90-1]
MPTLAEQQLSAEKFAAFCSELRALAAKPTLVQVQAVLVRYGVTSPTSKSGKPSPMAAKAVLDGPFARYVARVNAGRETREALCAAAGAGVHPLDAIEEAMVIELQDQLVGAKDGEVDVKYIVDQLTKLRASISMRENSRRQQQDLERKLTDSEARRATAERAVRVLERRLEAAQFDAAKAALAHVKQLGAIAGDKTIDDAERLERARKRLFGETPAGVRSLEQLDERPNRGGKKEHAS